MKRKRKDRKKAKAKAKGISSFSINHLKPANTKRIEES